MATGAKMWLLASCLYFQFLVLFSVFISDVRTSWNKLKQNTETVSVSLEYIFQHANKKAETIPKTLSVFCFRDVPTSEIKLQLNSAAVVGLKRNKILFYFRRPHISETKLKQNNETAWNILDVRTSWNWDKTKLSTVGWNEAPTVGSFVLFQFYFAMYDGLKAWVAWGPGTPVLPCQLV